MATHDPAKAAGFFSDRRDEDGDQDGTDTEHNVEDTRVPDTVAAAEAPKPPLHSHEFFAEDRSQAGASAGFFGGSAAASEPGPATDPSLRVPDPPFVAPPPYGDFDPFDPHAYRPQIPWYRKSSAKLALLAIAAAAVAIVVAASLLLVGDPEGGESTENPTTPEPSSTPVTSPAAPTTTPQSSAAAPPPPAPPPPPESPPPTAGTRATSAPQGPQYTQRPRSTWTRRTEAPEDSPNIPVLPSREFPNAGRN